MPDRVVLLRDACAAVGVAQLLRTVSCVEQRCAVADYVELSLAAQKSFSLNGASSSAACRELALVYVGRSHFFAEERVYIALPSMVRLLSDFCLYWASLCQGELTRQYIGFGRIAYLQTLGGGWASLRQADKALNCALDLYDTAVSIFDEATAMKCRVFIGWAHLWNGDVEAAVSLFELERREAVMRGDIIQETRCIHAIMNAKTNPTLRSGSMKGQFLLSDCWTKVFSGHDIDPIQSLLSH